MYTQPQMPLVVWFLRHSLTNNKDHFDHLGFAVPEL